MCVCGGARACVRVRVRVCERVRECVSCRVALLRAALFLTVLCLCYMYIESDSVSCISIFRVGWTCTSPSRPTVRRKAATHGEKEAKYGVGVRCAFCVKA